MDDERADEEARSLERAEAIRAKPSRPRKNLEVKRTDLVFPVDDSHPLADAQEEVEIDSIDHLEGFLSVDNWRQQSERVQKGTFSPCGCASSGQPSGILSETMLVRAAREKGKLLRLRLGDFIVPAGTVVTLSNAFNVINADIVKIAGELRCLGELLINCRDLHGGSGLINNDGQPGADGRDGGAAPAKPGKPGKAANGTLLTGPATGTPGTPGVAGGPGGTASNGTNAGPGKVLVDTLYPVLTVTARGGRGGRGGRGQMGGDGGDGFVTGGGAAGGAGGTAGAGGAGSAGGKGGDSSAIVVIWKVADLSGGDFTLISSAGPGGDGGLGGDPGSVGAGGTGGVGGWASFGANGPGGAQGASGTAGAPGGAGDEGLAPPVGYSGVFKATE